MAARAPPCLRASVVKSIRVSVALRAHPTTRRYHPPFTRLDSWRLPMRMLLASMLTLSVCALSCIPNDAAAPPTGEYHKEKDRVVTEGGATRGLAAERALDIVARDEELTRD